MNSWGIKTQRGKTWSNGSVHSVLKRMHQRDVRIENIRNKKFPGFDELIKGSVKNEWDIILVWDVSQTRSFT